MLKNKKIICVLLALILLLCVGAPAFAAGKGSVTVKYVNVATNKAIAKDKTLSGAPGKHFSVKVQDIEGYAFMGFDSSAKNDFVYPEGKMIVYVQYAKVVKATVKYLDQRGEKIKASTVMKGYESKTYNIETPYIKGYEVEKIEDPCYGEFGKSNYTIKVYYKGGASSAQTSSSSTTGTARLIVQSVDQDTGAVLQSIADKQVGVPRNVKFSDYQNGVSGYSLRRILVNGVASSGSSVRVTGNTVISYIYERNHAEPTGYATLYVAAVDRDNRSIICVLRSDKVAKGTRFNLCPSSINGYTYDYTEVNGGSNWSGVVSVDYDTTVFYYYRRVYQTQPTTQPIVQPTTQPIVQPTTQPTTQPVVQPTAAPSGNYDYYGNPVTGGDTGGSSGNYDFYGNPVTSGDTGSTGGSSGNYDFYGNPI